jgi:hypothetical protein
LPGFSAGFPGCQAAREWPVPAIIGASIQALRRHRRRAWLNA